MPLVFRAQDDKMVKALTHSGNRVKLRRRRGRGSLDRRYSFFSAVDSRGRRRRGTRPRAGSARAT